MKQYVEDFELTKKVDSFFSVKYKHPPREYKNGFMFTAGLADKTGEIEFAYWGGRDQNKVSEVYNSFREDDVVHVSGIVGQFNEKLKVDVNEGVGGVRKAGLVEYAIEDFVPATDKDVNIMTRELMSLIGSIKNPHLQGLLESMFNDENFRTQFTKAAGAMFIHHAYVGGLMEHTLNVCRICERLCEVYPQMDRDLVVCGAILHDIGKIRELRITTNIKVSEEGMLNGHIMIGVGMLSERIKDIPDFPESLKFKLAHILLSHHGSGEYGSPKAPQFPEAAAVYYADESDAKIEQYVKAKEDANTEDFRTYSKRLGELYLK